MARYSQHFGLTGEFISNQTTNYGACAMGDVKDQPKDKIEEVKNWAENTVDAVSDKAGDVATGVRDLAKQTLGKAQEGYQRVAEQSREVFRDADAAVRDNPHLSVGAALGAGLFVGVLVALALRSGRA
jgi:ElaB/YqjD/DUF883 family membrane-anchored ribosome-binding protein